jgi:uncharacterized YigZ family protein
VKINLIRRAPPVMSGNIKPVKTLKSSSESEIKEKGSLFKAVIFPVTDQQNAVSILNDIKKKYYDATHHCYAYRLKDENFRYSDDGEPSGTAGKRILNAIDHYDLKDVLCVVIRWFGGTKLGTGPLGKAYYSSAEEAIKNSVTVVLQPFIHYEIKASYEYTSQLYHIFDKYSIKIENRVYSDVPVYYCLLPYTRLDLILSELEAFPVNRADITNLGKISYI